MPAYVAGRVPAVRDGLPTYKLSANENPFPPLPEVLDAVRTSAATMNLYPDLGATALTEAVARRLGVSPAEVALGTGSVALLYHLVQAFCEPGDEVVYAWRSFEAYPIAVAVCGAGSVPVPLTADARHDLDAMAEAVTDRTRMVLVCTPNNPTGPAVTHADMEGFLAKVPTDVLIVLDEAYQEFVTGPDRLDALALQRRHPHVVVVRTFAKAHGLAGLRVGYLAAAPEVAAAVRACALPFGVSAVAQAAARVALDHEDAMRDRVAAIVAERARLVAELRDQGWSVPEAQGNFVWLGLGGHARSFADAAASEGVMVRAYGEDGVRLTVGEPAGNDALLGVAAAFDPKA